MLDVFINQIYHLKYVRELYHESSVALADDGVNRIHVLILIAFSQYKFGMIGDFSTKINIQLKYLVSFKRPNFLRLHLMMLWCNGTLMCARNVCQFLTLCRHSQNAMCHAYRLVRNYTIRTANRTNEERKKECICVGYITFWLIYEVY